MIYTSMAIGSGCQITGACGCLMTKAPIGLRIMKGVGLGNQPMVGPGSGTNRGVGRRITMVAGFMLRRTVGPGILARRILLPSGNLHWSHFSGAGKALVSI